MRKGNFFSSHRTIKMAFLRCFTCKDLFTPWVFVGRASERTATSDTLSLLCTLNFFVPSQRHTSCDGTLFINSLSFSLFVCFLNTTFLSRRLPRVSFSTSLQIRKTIANLRTFFDRARFLETFFSTFLKNNLKSVA